MNSPISAGKTLASTTLLVGATLITLLSQPSCADTPSNPVDPCALIRPADLQTALGKAFTVSGDVDDGETRTCHFETTVQILHVDVFTAKRSAAEFQADAKRTALRNSAARDKPASIAGLSAPFFIDEGEGRLVVWKNNVALFVEITEYNSGLTAPQLKSAREQLAKLGLARMN